MDSFTEAMILKKAKTRAALSFDILPQMFSSERELRQFCNKHNLTISFGREYIILREKKS